MNDRPGQDCLQLCSIRCHLPNVGKNADTRLYLLRGSITCLTSSKLCVLVFLVLTNFCSRFSVPMDSALSSGSVSWQKTQDVKTLQIKTDDNVVLILRMTKSQIQRNNHMLFTYYLCLILQYYLILNSRLVPENILIYGSATFFRSILGMHRNPRCGKILHLNMYGSAF